MRIFKSIALRVALVLPAIQMVNADDITLADGEARLSGTVRAIHPDGALELDSPLSPEPLQLKAGAVQRVEFTAMPATDAPAAMIELANGDRIPASIERLDERTLSINTPHAGRLAIERKHLSALQLGVSKQKVVYRGPKALGEWNGIDDSFKNLSFDNGEFVTNGQASAVKDIGLPRDFIVRFTLSWEERQTPNFQFFFADPLKPRGEETNRYYIQFNGAGLEIKRQSEKGKRYSPIAALNRTPNLFINRELMVELHISRSTSRLKLFLNGEPDGEWEDPIGSIPTGEGIAFVSNASNGTMQRISDIAVFELDDSRARHRAEDRGDGKQDSLITLEEDRLGGVLTEIRPSDEGLVFALKSDFHESPVEVPGSDVSTVFFAKPADQASKDAPIAFRLRLQDNGSLQVSSCRFDGDSVTVVHPLLGEIRVNRAGVLGLESLNATAAKTEP